MDLSTALGFRTASSAASAVDQQPAASRSASSRLASLGIGGDQDHGDEGDDSEEGCGQARLPGVSASSSSVASASLSQRGYPGDPSSARHERAVSGQPSSSLSSSPPSFLPRAAACHILLTDDTLDDRRHRFAAGSGSGMVGGAEDAPGTAGAIEAGGGSAGGSGSGSGSGSGASAEFLVAHYLFGAIKEGITSAAAVPSGSKSSSSTSLARPSTGESMAARARTTSAAAPGGRRARRRKVLLVDFACRGDAHWAAVGKRMGISKVPLDGVTHIVPTLYPRRQVSNAATSSSGVELGTRRSPSLFAESSAHQSVSANGQSEDRSDQNERATLTGDAALDPAKARTDGDRDERRQQEQSRRLDLDAPLSLVPTFRTVVDAMSLQDEGDDTETAEGALVILSEVSTMLLLGMSVGEVEKFVRALWARVRQVNGTLLTHLSLPSSPGELSIASASTELLLALVRLARAGGGEWISVQGLSSGRSGLVMGEITAHPLSSPSTGDDLYPRIPRDRPLQYRIEDNGQVRVFAKGTSEGFL